MSIERDLSFAQSGAELNPFAVRLPAYLEEASLYVAEAEGVEDEADDVDSDDWDELLCRGNFHLGDLDFRGDERGEVEEGDCDEELDEEEEEGQVGRGVEDGLVPALDVS